MSTTKLIEVLLTELVIPEVAAFIRKRYAADGRMPTDAEVIAGLRLTTDRIVAAGEAWLAAHPSD